MMVTLLCGLASMALGLLVYLLVGVPLAAVPRLGARGQARENARQRTWFPPLEIILRLGATHLRPILPERTRQKIDRSLVTAGEFGGITPDEFVALSAVSTMLGLAAASFFYRNSESVLAAIACLLLGPLLPAMQLRSKADQRCKQVDRALPVAIDLAALCMGAGLDFPGAIGHVVANMRRSPVRQELQRILQELSLGHTRQQALEAFASRVKSDAVREFVCAVVHAEEKGTPLSAVLSVQARALRARRSVQAEEAAARAGVMLMLPMLMMVVSIALLLMGPLFIEMSQGAIG